MTSKKRKQTKHIQEQMKEMQNGKTYSLNASGMMAKSEARAQSRVQLQHGDKINGMHSLCIAIDYLIIEGGLLQHEGACVSLIAVLSPLFSDKHQHQKVPAAAFPASSGQLQEEGRKAAAHVFGEAASCLVTMSSLSASSRQLELVVALTRLSPSGKPHHPKVTTGHACLCRGSLTWKSALELTLSLSHGKLSSQVTIREAMDFKFQLIQATRQKLSCINMHFAYQRNLASSWHTWLILGCLSSFALLQYSKANRHPELVMEKMMESSFSGTQSFPEALSPNRGSQATKAHRSLSSCCSPGQRTGMLHRNAFRRTPPLPRGRFNGITGPAYQQLEESRISDQDSIPCEGLSTGLKPSQNTSLNMQLPSRETSSFFSGVAQKDVVGYSSPRASSVPIIPSVGLDEACMQMQNLSDIPGIKWCTNSYSSELVNVSAPASSCLITEQQEVKILLETVQEQIRILTDARRSQDMELAHANMENSTSENTAFLPMSPVAKSEQEAQFVLKSETKRDSALIK
ncbi:Pro-neuregulin-3, membrane-bound isoform [Varanus komodoensis]|nr:Pro-neuregulin-3, membrane-bound isoform [Varanus komodoensis]